MIRRPGQNPGPQRSSSKRPWDRSLSMPATKATTAWRTHCRALGPKRRELRPGSHKSFGKSNFGTVAAVREAHAPRGARQREISSDARSLKDVKRKRDSAQSSLRDSGPPRHYPSEPSRSCHGLTCVVIKSPFVVHGSEARRSTISDVLDARNDEKRIARTLQR